MDEVNRAIVAWQSHITHSQCIPAPQAGGSSAHRAEVLTWTWLDREARNRKLWHLSDLGISPCPAILSRGAGGVARTRDKRIPADSRADSLASVPPTPPIIGGRQEAKAKGICT
ncbi:hypothetical protein PoB_002267300 [Plakobranchus ocellatus]|uniref:Uncharacterized protein n=1 Tax=Plakobranchus ocellatus TaxID=259542 RepID=A0AAV3ZMV2_9GAST|nr:hypothetical protein PoB_002267300 [Plakobranchus ocellatus]